MTHVVVAAVASRCSALTSNDISQRRKKETQSAAEGKVRVRDDKTDMPREIVV